MIVDYGICRIAIPIFAVFAVRPKKFCSNSSGTVELMDNGLPANVGIGIVP